MQKIRDFLQVIDILSKWIYNSVRYYYITAGVILIFRAAIFGTGRNYKWEIVLLMLISIRVWYALREQLGKYFHRIWVKVTRRLRSSN